MQKKVLIVGAGLTGAVIARQLAEAGIFCQVIDSRSHIGGNCYTERDPETGIMVHSYGPHIFHTANMDVWRWIQQFGEFQSYQHRVFAQSNGRVYSLPINLHTLNQFFGKTMGPEEAAHFVKNELAEDIKVAGDLNFEQQALSLVGRELYEAFFKGYTEKQWGLAASQIPGSILNRLPLRFNYDGSYFNHPVQAIPKYGYTPIIENILNHPNIRVELGVSFSQGDQKAYDHLFYSGQIDRYFRFSEGYLPYRTLDFEVIRTTGDFQGCPVMNYCDDTVPWTRITEHKHFSPWEKSDQSICFKEYSRKCNEGDIPYYPVKLASENAMLERYLDLSSQEPNTSFVGRLGAFKYLDMDQAIADAFQQADRFLRARSRV